MLEDTKMPTKHTSRQHIEIIKNFLMECLEVINEEKKTCWYKKGFTDKQVAIVLKEKYEDMNYLKGSHVRGVRKDFFGVIERPELKLVADMKAASSDVLQDEIARQSLEIDHLKSENERLNSLLSDKQSEIDLRGNIMKRLADKLEDIVRSLRGNALSKEETNVHHIRKEDEPKLPGDRSHTGLILGIQEKKA